MVCGVEQVKEMRRLSRLGGNKGRVVSRFIDRFVESNEIEFRQTLPMDWVLLDMACLVVNMRAHVAAILKRASEEDGQGLQWIASIDVFPWTSRNSVSYVVKLSGVGENGVQRRSMLAESHQVLDMIASIHEGWMAAGRSEVLREMYLGEEAGAIEERMGCFNDVVRGVYTCIESLGERVAALAGVLNSQVESVLPTGWSAEVKMVEFEEVEAA